MRVLDISVWIKIKLKRLSYSYAQKNTTNLAKFFYSIDARLAHGKLSYLYFLTWIYKVSMIIKRKPPDKEAQKQKLRIFILVLEIFKEVVAHYFKN